MTIETLIALSVLLTAIAGLGWWLRRGLQGAAPGVSAAEVQTLRQEREQLLQRNSALQAREQAVAQQNDALNERLRQLQGEATRLTAELSAVRAGAEAQARAHAEKVNAFAELQSLLKTQYELSSTKALETNSSKFKTEASQQLLLLLKPFQEQIEHLHRDVKEAAKERHTLESAVKGVMHEANALTKALRGDNKVQGDWGETLLQNILNLSGLEAGRDYEAQSVFKTDEGQLKPDFVLRLPENRFIVIDSKVSLTAYASHVNARDEQEAAACMSAHLQSLRAHIQGLSGKYERLPQREVPDFTLMWVPIEPALHAAMAADASLVDFAMSKRVIPVSATTLFAVLKIIQRLWQYERQNQNVQAIIDRGGVLYDKVQLFLESMNDVGRHLSNAAKSYSEARGRLSEGRGNIVNQAEELRRLGAKIKKPIGTEWLSEEETPAAVEEGSKVAGG